MQKKISDPGATTMLLEYLKTNGPQTYKQLERLSFWMGVRSRFYDFIKQGRIQKCDVINPESGPHMRAVVIGYRVSEDVFTGNIRLLFAEQRAAIKLQERMKLASLRSAKKEISRMNKMRPKLEAAKKLLEANGYSVTHNNPVDEPEQ